MRIIWKERVPGQIEFGIIYGIIALLAVVAAAVLPILDLAPACVWKGLFGVSCPTCGATRALVLLAQGDLRAVMMNPLAAAAVIGSIVILCCHLVTLIFPLPRPGLALSENERRFAPVAAGIGLAVHWAYLLLTHDFLTLP